MYLDVMQRDALLFKTQILSCVNTTKGKLHAPFIDFNHN